MSEILIAVQKCYGRIYTREGHLVQNSMVSTDAMLTVASVATLIRRASRSGEISSPIVLAGR